MAETELTVGTEPWSHRGMVLEQMRILVKSVTQQWSTLLTFFASRMLSGFLAQQLLRRILGWLIVTSWRCRWTFQFPLRVTFMLLVHRVIQVFLTLSTQIFLLLITNFFFFLVRWLSIVLETLLLVIQLQNITNVERGCRLAWCDCIYCRWLCRRQFHALEKAVNGKVGSYWNGNQAATMKWNHQEIILEILQISVKKDRTWLLNGTFLSLSRFLFTLNSRNHKNLHFNLCERNALRCLTMGEEFVLWNLEFPTFALKHLARMCRQWRR